MKKSLLCFLLIATFLMTACSNHTTDFADEVVLKIDGQEITKSEYMTHLYTTSMDFISSAGEDAWSMDFEGQTADELVESHTITTLQRLVAAKKYAAENNINLTEQEKEEAKLSAEKFISGISKDNLAKMGIDTEKLTAIMEASYLYSSVYNSISEKSTVDDAEVDRFFNENKTGLMEKFKLLKVNSIVVDNRKTAMEVLEKAKNGEDFSKLFDAYDTARATEGTGENGEMTVYRYVLESQYGLSPNATVGDVEGPFHMGSTYFILKVAEEVAPDASEVKKLAGETYRTNMQALHAQERIDELIANQKVEKVEAVWKTLENFH